MKPRIIDEHDRVRPLVAKMAIGQEDQPHERRMFRNRARTTSPPGSRAETAGFAGLFHVGSAEAVKLGVGKGLAKRPNQLAA